MAYYVRCRFCGAYLDPGECCDCQKMKPETETEKPRIKKDPPVEGPEDQEFSFCSLNGKQI